MMDNLTRRFTGLAFLALLAVTLSGCWNSHPTVPSPDPDPSKPLPEEPQPQ